MPSLADITRITQQFWGYDKLRPLQPEAIDAGIAQRDSLVVMPTGGGKSLCYQVPPVLADRCDIVVSPLISLMKDQVDGLRAMGYRAVAIHSNMSPQERNDTISAIRSGGVNLLFVAPERLMTPRFLSWLNDMKIGAFAIDEAHCISHWGHDFRPEYRRLAELKNHFPKTSIHAFTATATERVRDDIIQQLGLSDPTVLVGTFDRPNLVYRVVPKTDQYAQVTQIVRRHHNEAVIVYCLSRKDTESMAETLRANGINARHYHAGMEREERTAAQEAFAREEVDVICATVAFGMGIDRSNVRCVIHASVPKSVEHYQQETGRAGRDGLEAECVLLYSYSDVMTWEYLINKTAAEASEQNGQDLTESVQAQYELLGHITDYCSGIECRHRALSRYFGQRYDADNCGACDVCLDEIEGLPDATEIAQKILSCVARVEQRFGIGHVVSVLRGQNTAAIRRCGHDQISTYGILREIPEKTLTNLAYQLVDQGLLERTSGDRPTVHLNDDSMSVLRGDCEVRLVEPETGPTATTILSQDEWEHVDRKLFDLLRDQRREMAQQQDVPAFVIFSDATLRELARVRPTTMDTLQAVSGIGRKKLADYGELLLDIIAAYCRSENVLTDQITHAGVVQPGRTKKNATKEQAMRMFAEGKPLEMVASKTGRAISTASRYLEEFIENERPTSIETWVDEQTCQQVTDAAMQREDGRLKPIYEALNKSVPYEQIRIVMAHLRAVS